MEEGDAKYRGVTRELEGVDVAAPMEEARDVKQKVVPRELRVVGYA